MASPSPRLRWTEEVRADLRFALRYFGRHRATVAIIVVVLALATGANTAIFSIFQAEFHRPPPAVPADDNVVGVWSLERATRSARWERRSFSGRELGALSARPDVFREVAGWLEEDVVIQAGDSGEAHGATAHFVSPNFFRALGVPLVAGPGFAVNADGPDLAAILSFAAAERLYGSAAGAVGRIVVVNELPLRVAGVATRRFQGPMRNMDDPVAWIPLSARVAIARVSPTWMNDSATLSVVGRLAPNVSLDVATAFTAQVVTAALPDSAARVGLSRTAQVLGISVLPPGNESDDGFYAVLAIFGIGILILLVAWTNVSALMVSAAVGRRHEIAVRLSLGASRARLVRQFVTESTLLSGVAAALGLLLAWWLLLWGQRREITGVDITPDATTFVFVFLLAIVTGVLFGLSPAVHATRGAVANAIRDSGAGATSRARLQRAFVGAQIAFSQPLLVLLGTMISLIIADYRPLAPALSREVITAWMRPLAATGTPSQRADAVDSLIPRIAALPGVAGAVPAATGFDVRGVRAGSDTAPTILHLEGAAPGWFRLVDVPVILGRDVSLSDSAAAEVPIVIGSDVAHALWQGENPLGRRLASPSLPGMGQDSLTLTVVGVYDATRTLPGMTFGGYLSRTTSARVYTAWGKHWQRDRILVRTRGAAEPYLPELRRFLQAAAPSLPIRSMMTLEQVDARSYRETLQMAAAAGAGGGVALLLACLGLYGIVSLAVQQRRREIGVRIAVGANPTTVARMFLGSGVRVSAVALCVGLPLSLIGLRAALRSGVIIAPGVNALLIGVAIAVVMLVVASAASWVPARRAAKVDPASTLRVE